MCYFLTGKNEVEANLNNGDICEFDPHRHAGHLFLTKLRELITGAVRALHDLIFVSWFLPSTCLFSFSSHTLSSCCSLSFSISLLSTLSLTKQREEWQLHKSKKLTMTNSKWKWCYPLSIPNITDIKASLKIGFTMSNYTFFTLVTITTTKLKLFGLFFFRKDIDIFNNSLK